MKFIANERHMRKLNFQDLIGAMKNVKLPIQFVWMMSWSRGSDETNEK